MFIDNFNNKYDKLFIKITINIFVIISMWIKKSPAKGITGDGKRGNSFLITSSNPKVDDKNYHIIKISDISLNL